MTQGKHAHVNGLNMYYEIHGASQPLVLLHGALSATGTSFGKILPSLAETRQVIAVEQQAHGHTADIDRPLTIEQMADDTAALLHHIGIEIADFLGYSMGAGIALQIADCNLSRRAHARGGVMRFHAIIQLSGKTATGIRVPAKIVERLGASKRPPVRVTIGGYTYRSTLATLGGEFKKER